MHARSERVEVGDGVRLHVRVHGAPATAATGFILVHGLASNARLWDGVARSLAARGHPVAAVDQRGHGLSDKPHDGYDFATVTDDLHALIGALGWGRPVVAGQSWGGNVVIELAWRFPGLARGIACIDGGTIELGHRFPTWEACEAALAPPRLAGTAASRIEAAIRATHPDWPEDGIAGAMHNFEVMPDGTVRPWLARDRHLAILRALWEHRPSTRYAGIADPVLLVPADSGDAGWTAEKRAGVDRAVASLARARARWFSPADHDVHAQYPDELADTLVGCLDDGFFA